MWGGRRSSAGVLAATHVFTERLHADVVGYKVWVVLMLVKIVPTSVMVDYYGVFNVVFLLRRRCCSLRHLGWAALGETLDPGLSGHTMTTPSVSLSLLRASFWKKC